MSPPGDDPYGGDILLRDCVERALTPHRTRLDGERLEALRDYLIVFITTHPAAEPLYARLRSRPSVAQSTLVEQMRAHDASRPDPASTTSKQGRRA